MLVSFGKLATIASRVPLTLHRFHMIDCCIASIADVYFMRMLSVEPSAECSDADTTRASLTLLDHLSQVLLHAPDVRPQVQHLDVQAVLFLVSHRFRARARDVSPT